MLKYLRIAATALSVTVCVLLVALWVRSYTRHDGIRGLIPVNQRFSLSSAYGSIRFATFDRSFDEMFSGYRASDWGLSSSRMDRRPSMTLVNTPLTNFGLGFAGSSDRYGIVAIVPTWFVVGFTLTVGVAPWFANRLTFSLRTLLIATTLVAIVLGMVVYLAR
jgi:hypothetical protein